MQTIQTSNHKEHEWATLVQSCHQHPLQVNVDGIYFILDQLNTKTAETHLAFDLQTVIDGVVPPNVAPRYFDGRQMRQPIKAERTGPIIQAVLDKLPLSVRSGVDEKYSVHQIRLDDYESWDHMMGTTTLLIVFLEDKNVSNCYLFPDDPNSVTNWDALNKMHLEHFPQLGER